ncbi:MAG TPA: class I SAM-dependent methyltransferase [Candidatus Dormibacteraeota bacterium]
MLEPEIGDHYASVPEDDRITSGLGRLELLRTQEVLRRHLPAPPAAVVDIGGGAGVHARWLSEAGYRVHLIDPVPRHVEAARALLEAGGGTAALGDARGLDLPADSFDLALLLGPLYHLTERADRLRALAEAARVVKGGGLIAVAAISRFASLFDGLARGFLFDPEFRAIVERDLRDGEHRNPNHRPHWFTTAYFHRPEDLRAEAGEAGLQVRELVGLEGLGAWLPQLEDRWETEDGRQIILDAARAVESEPALLALSPHLLLIATAP